MAKERRQFPRYKIGNAVSTNSEGVFQVVDISEGGFRFKCAPHTLIPETWVTDIINSITTLVDFPARKIWVSIYQLGNYNLPSLTVVGVKFIKLENEQKLKLTQLLQGLSENQMRKAQ